jgi:outer membrane protein TolC
MRTKMRTESHGSGRPARFWPVPRHMALSGCLLALVCACPLSAFADPAQDSDIPTVTLEQCVEQALKEGPDIRVSEAAIESARAQYTAAEAENRLGLSGSASLGHSNSSSVALAQLTGNDSTPMDSGGAGLTLTAPLGSKVGLSVTHDILETSPLRHSTNLSASASTTVWDGYLGGGTLASARQASFTLQQALLTQEAARRTIIYDVKQAYYTALAQQREIGILSQTLEMRREEMRKTLALHDSGNANLIDVRQAQVNLTAAELDARKARGSLEIDRENLSVLMGWPVERTFTVAETGDLSAPTMDVAEAVKAALSGRADLRQYAAKIASGEIDIALARAKGSPTVSASAGMDVSQSWRDTSSISLGWSGSVQVGMPILDAGATAAAVKKAQAANVSLAVQRDKLAATIATEVKNAVYGLQDLLARADLAQASVDLAQSRYDLARMQFESGSGSNLDVLDASVTLTTAQVALAKARADAQLGVLALQDAMGL